MVARGGERLAGTRRAMLVRAVLGGIGGYVALATMAVRSAVASGYSCENLCGTSVVGSCCNNNSSCANVGYQCRFPYICRNNGTSICVGTLLKECHGVVYYCTGFTAACTDC